MWILLFLQATFLIGYLTGSDALKKPLSAKEEALCLERMRQGDEEARRILIEHNLRLVAHIARKYNGASKTWETDDLISVGSIGLIKGLDTFRPEKKARLSTYLAKCVENEIRMLLRTERHTRQDVSLQEPIGQDKEGNTITYNDTLEYDDSDMMESIDYMLESDHLREAMEKSLNRTERRILTERYGLDGGEPMTQWQVASRLGISRSYVSRIEKKAIGLLKEAMRVHQ